MGIVSEVTNNIIDQLYNSGELDKASLAALRDASSFESHQATKIWPLFFETINQLNLDTKERGKILTQTGTPSYTQQAIFTALKMYAIYQRGIDDHSVADEKGRSFFQALNKVRNERSEEDRQSLDRRATNLFGSTNIQGILNSLVQLQRLLKSENDTLTINYGKLSADILQLQFDYESMRKVILRWGQDYFNRPLVKKEND